MNIFKRSKLSFLRLQNVIKNKIEDRINVLFGFHFTECFFVLEVVKIYKESCIFRFMYWKRSLLIHLQRLVLGYIP